MQKSLIFILVLFLSACGSDDSPPADIIPEEKMAVLIADVHVIEARLSKISLMSLDSATIIVERLKMDNFKKNKVDSAQYNRSYKFYSTHPDYLERIYKNVIKDLEKRFKKKDYRGL